MAGVHQHYVGTRDLTEDGLQHPRVHLFLRFAVREQQRGADIGVRRIVYPVRADIQQGNIAVRGTRKRFRNRRAERIHRADRITFRADEFIPPGVLCKQFRHQARVFLRGGRRLLLAEEPIAGHDQRAQHRTLLAQSRTANEEKQKRLQNQACGVLLHRRSLPSKMR